MDNINREDREILDKRFQIKSMKARKYLKIKTRWPLKGKPIKLQDLAKIEIVIGYIKIFRHFVGLRMCLIYIVLGPTASNSFLSFLINHCFLSWNQHHFLTIFLLHPNYLFLSFFFHFNFLIRGAYLATLVTYIYSHVLQIFGETN